MRSAIHSHALMRILGLSAAFDTVDPMILWSNCDTAIYWFRSYLADRTMILLGLWDSPELNFRTSSLSLYLLPLKFLMRKHGVSFHCNADDSQLCVPINKNCSSIKPLLSCLHDIKNPMALSFLSFNDQITERMVFGPSDSCDPSKVNLGLLALHSKQWTYWGSTDWAGFGPYVIIPSLCVGVSLWQQHQLRPLCLPIQWPIYSLQGRRGPRNRNKLIHTSPSPVWLA
uniref:Reverse transcriptase domain-containing protein n=1 Tax=Oryzias latipes TaxID=8090 RepID=A0A3B3ICY2_ORYLA